jgi:hypothetical protein
MSHSRTASGRFPIRLCGDEGRGFICCTVAALNATPLANETDETHVTCAPLFAAPFAKAGAYTLLITWSAKARKASIFSDSGMLSVLRS